MTKANIAPKQLVEHSYQTLYYNYWSCYMYNLLYNSMENSFYIVDIGFGRYWLLLSNIYIYIYILNIFMYYILYIYYIIIYIIYYIIYIYYIHIYTYLYITFIIYILIYIYIYIIQCKKKSVVHVEDQEQVGWFQWT